MEARLQWLVQKPASWAHWEPVRGGWNAQALLQTRYPQALAYLREPNPQHAALLHRAIATPWWNPLKLRAAKAQVAEPTQPVGMLWANMALHHAADPQALIHQWLGMLEVGGFLMFSCMGPETLQEIRTVYAAQGWPPPTHAFTDMHDWGDMLVEAGFAEPVMDMERITLSFSTPQALLAELRTLGRNLSRARFGGLRTAAWRASLHDALQQGLADPRDGNRLKVSFEIIYGHAFKPSPRFTAKPQTNIDVESLRRAAKATPRDPVK
ncbi:MAG: biotin synthase [Betaproteobacteria bacterium]|nr:biotin synthase [Betaproteobacteria bacterium]